LLASLVLYVFEKLRDIIAVYPFFKGRPLVIGKLYFKGFVDFFLARALLCKNFFNRRFFVFNMPYIFGYDLRYGT